METLPVYLPKSSPNYEPAEAAFGYSCCEHAGWGVGLDGPARHRRIASLIRWYLGKFFPDAADLAREDVAAALRRGLCVSADHPGPDPDDESRAAVEAWRVWRDAIEAEIARMESTARCPCPPTTSAG